MTMERRILPLDEEDEIHRVTEKTPLNSNFEDVHQRFNPYFREHDSLDSEQMVFEEGGRVEVQKVGKMEERDEFNRAQKIGQEIIKFIGAATPPYLFIQLLPVDEIPEPHKSAIDTGNFAMNGILDRGGMATSTKEDELSYVKALGRGKKSIGFAKLVTTTLGGLTVAVASGYGFGKLKEIFLPQLRDSNNENLMMVGYLLTDPAIVMPVLGTIGYLKARGAEALGMKLWEHYFPSEAEKTSNHVRWTQKAGQYTSRLFLDLTSTEAVLFYMNFFGQSELVSDPRMQIGIFLSMDSALMLGRYFSFVPHPINAICPPVKDSLILEDHEGSVVYLQRERASAIRKRALSHLAISATAYAISEITCLITPVCAEDTLSNRTIRLVAALGIPLACDYVIEYVKPKFSLLANNFCSMFRRQEPYFRQLDFDDEEQEDTSLLTDSPKI